MSKLNFGLLAFFGLILTSCGGDNDNLNNPNLNNPNLNNPYGNSYGYSQPYPNGMTGGRVCPPAAVNDWRALVASPCAGMNGNWQGGGCIGGAQAFQARHQGITCNMPVAQGGWFPGPETAWQQQTYFMINDAMMRAFITQYGGMADRSVPVGSGGWGYPR